MPDSTTITIDSAATVYYIPQWTDGFPNSDTIDDAATVSQSVTSLPSLEVPEGSNPVSLPNTPLRDTGTMIMLLLALFFVVMSYRTGYKYLEKIGHNLFSVRRRENMFDDNTINETQILTTLTLNASVVMGIIGFYALDLLVPSLSAQLHNNVWLHTSLLSGIVLVFYLLQLIAYNVVGFTFADGVATRLWTDGFKAAHSLTGILLLPVAGALLVWPQECKLLLTIAIILYFCCRIAFICKGFRIFYSNLPSLVYFILYLCSVEIVPLVLLVVCTVYLSGII